MSLRANGNGEAQRPAQEAKAARGQERLDEGAVLHILGYRLAQASIVMRGVFNRHVGEPLNLRTVEFTVLMLLLANEDVTPSLISRTLAMSAPNLTQLLDRLAERGLVARERSPHDRRAQHIRLTRAGRALAKKAHEISLGMEQQALQHLSEAERAMLFELLQRVAARRRPHETDPASTAARS
ncbi:MAG TPA: MarR family transcriptional regulator [Burkholderiaceae bacterium]|nr:MarR family transcriptional regulator [Burkholderiaceae bacterium]